MNNVTFRAELPDVPFSFVGAGFGPDDLNQTPAFEAEWAHALPLRDGKVVAFRDDTDTAVVVAELAAARART